MVTPYRGGVDCKWGRRGQKWPIWIRFFAKCPCPYGFGESLFFGALIFSNPEFQIWGSAFIEPKCSGHYFSGFEVPARWNLKSGKVARWSQRVQLNCIFEGLKIAKKCGFQFHPISSTTRFWFQAFWHLMRREGLLTRCQGHCVFSWNAKLGFLIVELQYVVFHFHFLEFFFVSFYVKLVSAW